MSIKDRGQLDTESQDKGDGERRGLAGDRIGEETFKLVQQHPLLLHEEFSRSVGNGILLLKFWTL